MIDADAQMQFWTQYLSYQLVRYVNRLFNIVDVLSMFQILVYRGTLHFAITHVNNIIVLGTVESYMP